MQEFEEIRLWSFECADCERSADIAALTTRKAARSMRSNGWIVDTTRTTCPTCATGAMALESAAAEPGRREALVGLGGVITA